MPTARRAHVLARGLHFGECPRWHDGRLWLSDVHGYRVVTVDAAGRVDEVARLATQPAGLGWTPDGRLLAVSMVDRRLLRLDGGRWETVADLAGLASGHCNDMVVDARGRAYVGTFGFDLDGGAPYAPGEVVLVDGDGSARVAASGLRFPNGMVLTPDGRTLLVAETMAPALRAFDVAPDGSLANGRTWAALTDVVPDGICRDAEGAVWAASPIASEVVRIAEGGRILERVAVSNHAFACMLGGFDRRMLHVLTADNSNPAYCRAHASGRVETIAVDVPGAGRP
jgi:sugar lactone lactonase YvrE